MVGANSLLTVFVCKGTFTERGKALNAADLQTQLAIVAFLVLLAC